MGWFFGLLAVAAALLLFETDHNLLTVIAIFAAVGVFWSWGKMRKFVTSQARLRSVQVDGSAASAGQEGGRVPDWIASLNMVCSLLGLALLIIGIIYILQS